MTSFNTFDGNLCIIVLIFGVMRESWIKVKLEIPGIKFNNNSWLIKFWIAVILVFVVSCSWDSIKILCLKQGWLLAQLWGLSLRLGIHQWWLECGQHILSGPTIVLWSMFPIIFEKFFLYFSSGNSIHLVFFSRTWLLIHFLDLGIIQFFFHCKVICFNLQLLLYWWEWSVNMGFHLQVLT